MLANETADESLTGPRRSTFLECDDDRAARRGDDGVLELHRGGARFGVEREAVILRRIDGKAAAQRQERLDGEHQTVAEV